MPDGEVPSFRVRNVGEPIPSVDPEDLRRRWNIKPPWTLEARLVAQSLEADSSAVSRRDGMIRMLTVLGHAQLLAPWRHGEDLDDAVFRVAATFPIRALREGVYKLGGDEIFGFDPNAFVQRLIEETGISHVWEPIKTKISEGGFLYTTVRATLKGQGPPDPERDARGQTLELLWDVWSRYDTLYQSLSDKESLSHLVAMLFADFVIDNFDLARQFVSRSGTGESRSPVVILQQLERRAQSLRP